MNEEVEQINSEIEEYRSKIKELEEKKQTILTSDLKIGRFVKILGLDGKEYICISSITCCEEGILNTGLKGLTIYKPFGGDYFIMPNDVRYINKNDIIEITREEFEKALDEAIDNFKSIIQ